MKKFGVDFRMMVVYLTTNSVTGKQYIGAHYTHRPLSRRYLGSGSDLKKDIKTYGRSKFYKRILRFCKSPEDLRVSEQYYMLKYNAVNLLDFYNMSLQSSVGNYGNTHSVESIEAAKIKMAEYWENNDHPNKGKPQSAESKRKNSESNKARPRIQCEYCGEMFQKTPYIKFHGDKCLKNPNLTDIERALLVEQRRPNEETLRKRSESLKNVDRTKEWSDNISKSKKGKMVNPIVKCPHCGKEGSNASLAAWHFDHCLKNLDIDLNKEMERREAINDKIRSQEKIECEYCGGFFIKGIHTRFHGINCKLNKN